MPGIVPGLRQQLMITLVNIALITCVFLGTIGTGQGAASITPGESSKGASDDQQKQIAAIKSVSEKIFTSLGNALAPGTLSKPEP